MCLNQRKIQSSYMRRPLYVPCGHCKACLQQKAARRVYRIRNNASFDKVCFMVALTYSRGTSPYVDRNEAYEFSSGLRKELNVYRDCVIRKVRKASYFNQYNQVYKRTNKRVVLDTIDFIEPVSMRNTKDMAHEFSKISVGYYKDYQGFLARYRLNLKRHYNYEKKVSVYACQEFGTKSDRSHFHLLIFGNKSDKEILRSAIYESWPFSDLRRFPRAVEESFQAASYVASYVNKPRGFSPFLSLYFRSKHSYSKGFGIQNEKFSLSSVLAAFEKGSLSFNVLKNNNGFPVAVAVPFPKYVINRFFPQFKGYNRFTPCKAFQDMRGISQLDFTERDIVSVSSPSGFGDKDFIIVDGVSYTPEEYRRAAVCLRNGWFRFKEFRDCSLDDYLLLHRKVWTCYASTVLRLHMENDSIPLLEKYDNLDEVVSKNICPVGFSVSDIKVTDPNKFITNRLQTYKYSVAFDDNIKHRKVASEIYHAIDNSCEL